MFAKYVNIWYNYTKNEKGSKKWKVNGKMFYRN